MTFKNDGTPYTPQWGWHKGFRVETTGGGVAVVKVDRALKNIVLFLDYLVGIYYEANYPRIQCPPELTVTATVEPRPEGTSCHPYGYAVDIRTKDMPPMLKGLVTSATLMAKQANQNIRYQMEAEGRPNEHLHIQLYELREIKNHPKVEA